MVGKNVQLSSEVALPAMIKQQIIDRSFILLQKYEGLFDVARLQLHLKNDGAKIACTMNLFTDDGAYHAHASGWDVRQIIQDAADRLSLQLHKRTRRHASAVMYG